MRLRLIRLGLACLSLLLVPALARAEQSVLDGVKSSGTLKACVAQVIPEAFKDAKTGEWHGVSVDLLNLLAGWMNVKLKIVEVSWNTAVLSLKRGDCDMFGSSLVYNVPRALQVSYIVPFYRKGVNLIVPKNAKRTFASPKDFNDSGVTIAVTAGTNDEDVARKQFAKAKMLSLNVASEAQSIEALRRGDADAALVSTFTMRWWLSIPQNAAWAKTPFPGQDLFPATNGWAIRYGDPDWKSFLDSFARWAVTSGTVQSLYDQYFDRVNPFK